MALHTLYARPSGSPAGTKWVRISAFSHSKRVAVVRFQNFLLAAALGQTAIPLRVEIRPLRKGEPEQVPVDAIHEARKALKLA